MLLNALTTESTVQYLTATSVVNHSKDARKLVDFHEFEKTF